MTDASNVVPFAPQPKQAPFQFVEVRLRDDLSLQVNAVDAHGGIVVFEYKLAAPVKIGDCERLLAGWKDWRDTSTAAS